MGVGAPGAAAGGGPAGAGVMGSGVPCAGADGRRGGADGAGCVGAPGADAGCGPGAADVAGGGGGGAGADGRLGGADVAGVVDATGVNADVAGGVGTPGTDDGADDGRCRSDVAEGRRAFCSDGGSTVNGASGIGGILGTSTSDCCCIRSWTDPGESYPLPNRFSSSSSPFIILSMSLLERSSRKSSGVLSGFEVRKFFSFSKILTNSPVEHPVSMAR